MAISISEIINVNVDFNKPVLPFVAFDRVLLYSPFLTIPGTLASPFISIEDVIAAGVQYKGTLVRSDSELGTAFQTWKQNGGGKIYLGGPASQQNAALDGATITLKASATAKQYALDVVTVPATVTVNFTLAAGKTAKDLYDGLANEIRNIKNASKTFTVTSSDSGITVTAVSSKVEFSFTENADFGVSNLTSSEGQGTTDTLTAISKQLNFYFLTTLNMEREEECADWAETNGKVFVCRQAYDEVKDQPVSTEDRYTKRKKTNKKRSATIYSKDAAKFPELAWIARKALREPGSVVWAFAELSNIEPDDLSTAQYQNLKDRNINVYTTVAQRNLVLNGTVSSGDFIDDIISIDFLKSEIERGFLECVVSRTEKIPYDETGITIIVDKLNTVLQAGKKYILDSYKINIPNLDTLPSATKATRRLPLKIDTFLKGAIQGGDINVNVNFGGA